MPMLRATPDFTRAAQHLREDHVAFETRFQDLCARALGGEWKDLDEVWDSFADDLEAHLEFEEDLLFPRFSARDPESREIVARLEQEHAAIRKSLEELGIQIQLKYIRADAIEAFVQVMREHAARENVHLYPWATELGRAIASDRPDRDRDAAGGRG